MTDSTNRASLLDVFPDVGKEIDLRVNHSETRIKNWVVTGVVVNLIALLVAALPMVYTLGQIAATFDASVAKGNNTSRQITEIQQWQREREVWAAGIEAYLITKGYQPQRAERQIRESR